MNPNEYLNESSLLDMGIIDEDCSISLLNESIFKDEPDIYYKKDKFDNKEINLCFITGLSGSGKSTMGSNMEEDSSDVEHVDLDNVFFQFTKKVKALDISSSMYNSFFNTDKGKKYKELDKKYCITKSGEYGKSIIKDFIDYAIEYADTHKNQRFVIDGTWLFHFIEPEYLKDYAVYIKGTSAVKSMSRRIKRDVIENDDLNVLLKAATSVGTAAKYIYRMKYNSDDVDKYRKYYENKKESIKVFVAKEEYLVYDNIPTDDLFYHGINEVTVQDFGRLIARWTKDLGDRFIRVYDNSFVSDDNFKSISKAFEIMKTTNVYSEYRAAFRILCKQIEAPRNYGITIRKYILEKSKSPDNNRVYVQYSIYYNKVKIPKSFNLYHLSIVPNIKALKPAFRGKGDNPYYYSEPRVYASLYKIPRIFADYSPVTKIYRYRINKKIKYVYVDPLISTILGGCVFIPTFEDISVDEPDNLSKEDFKKYLSYGTDLMLDLTDDLMMEMSCKYGIIPSNMDKSILNEAKEYIPADEAYEKSKKIILKKLKSIVEKYNNDESVWKHVRHDIDEYIKDCKETYGEDDNPDMSGYETSGDPKFKCVRDKNDKPNTLTVHFSDRSDDLDVLLVDYIKYMMRDLRQDKEVNSLIKGWKFSFNSHGVVEISIKKFNQ